MTIDIAHMISVYGLAVMVPLAIVEGPIVTIIAAYLASLRLLDPLAVLVCAVAGDLIGDCLLYWFGRGGRHLRIDRIPLIGRRFRLPPKIVAPLVRAIRRNGIRLLALGKLTHAAGFAVLIAAGIARMHFALFFLVNVLTSIPKVLILMAIGYVFGSAHASIADWLPIGSLVAFGAIVAGGVLIYLFRRKGQTCLTHS